MFKIIILLYIAFVWGVVSFLYRLGIGRFFQVLLFFILLFLPLWEQFLGMGLMMDFHIRNKPLKQITRTVEMPGSVLWIDNVWPGFDGYAREFMVKSYLDGVRLKTLALNDGNGHLYVYRASEKDFAVSESMRPAVQAAKKEWETAKKRAGRWTKEVVRYQLSYFKKDDRFCHQRELEAEPILRKPEIYPFENQMIPKEIGFFDYRVEWNPIPLSGFRAKHIWCDELGIEDLKRNEMIGFNKRCLQYSPDMQVIFRGGDPFEGGAKLGDTFTSFFDDEVLFSYAKVVNVLFETQRSGLRKESYSSGLFHWEQRQKQKKEINDVK